MNGGLPTNWQWSTISEVASVQLGRQRSPQHHAGDQMRSYLRSANVTWEGVSLDDVKEMNFDDNDFEKYRLEPGDILLNEASGSPNEVGKPAIWHGQIDECCFQNTLLRLRSHEVERDYIYWYCFMSALSGRFGEAGRGVNIRHLGKGGLEQFPIPVAPLSQQKRIVAAIEEHFSRLDAVEATAVSARRRLGILRNAIMDRMIYDATESIRTVEIGDLADVSGGIQKQPKRRPRENRYPFLRVANVGRGHLDLADVHEIELFKGEIDRFRLRKGDLLVVEGNGSVSQIGRAALWGGQIEDCVHQNHLIRVRPGEGLLPEYLTLCWNAPRTAQQIQTVASSTSGLYTLSTRKVKSIRIPAVPLSVQRSVVEQLDQRLRSIEMAHAAAEDASGHARALRRAVLAQAFSGQLVPQDPNDEPASALLDRISGTRRAYST
ncbi:MAG: restriction endonuclease subunit S [Acidimicrobiia bacterium]|nr:restriction endonuclease subunit S [Acidimicrobiia bacterium]MYB09532.1 restriction endonuclease subunit S [Acidimicrobiia bacterium]MYB75284.1 restriction endonuclease subunit S [Acidimicrobiia bacterium]MYG58823.1 restriction endonuclease subunit S [Acidimicrobiia bacterium]MYH97844.1 restriction endonuclease subunit S [Acidimicrobiia bacterium]